MQAIAESTTRNRASRSIPPERTERGREIDFVRKAQSGDMKAMDHLIRQHLGLVSLVARHYRCRSHSHEDLVQEGVVGLITAIRRFEPRHGCRLSTYALHWVRQGIARAVEQKDRMIHVPARAASELRRIERLRQEHLCRRGREATAAELAAACGLSEERILQMLRNSEETISLETLLGAESTACFYDVARDPDAIDPEQHLVHGSRLAELQRGLDRLRPRERSVVSARYGLDGQQPQTLEQLGRSLNLSREGIRQIEMRAIRKLRHALEGA